MINVTINPTTPAFNPAPQLEAARILRALAERLERAATVQDLDKIPLLDRHGITIGSFTIGNRKQNTATKWRISQRTFPAIRGTNQLAVTPEQFDEALDAYADHVTKDL